MSTKKLSRKDYMSEEQFWMLFQDVTKISLSYEEQISKLSEKLKTLSEKSLFGFGYHLKENLCKSFNSKLWAVAFIVMGGCTEDGFNSFRMWLISRGKEIFNQALENPDSLVDEFEAIPEGELPEFETDYLLAKAFVENFGKNFYDEEDKFEDDLELPIMQLDWDEDDEDSLQKILPHTFERWWGNTKF